MPSSSSSSSTTTTTTTKPLPKGQQLLLQRLMSSHVMSNVECLKTINSIVAEEGEQEQEGSFGIMFDTTTDDGNNKCNNNTASSLTTIFSNINKQLKPCFGLEIISMVDTNYRDDNDDNDNDIANHTYHAVINTKTDDVSKLPDVFNLSYTNHERAMIRLLLERLVVVDNHLVKRMDCINLRSELEGGFKLTLDQAERLIKVLLEEQWLRVSTKEDVVVVDDDDDEEEEDEEEDDDENDKESTNRKKRSKKRSSRNKKRSSKNSKNSKRRRESVQNMIELAPRSYMELSHYLTTQLGLESDNLPQFVFHR